MAASSFSFLLLVYHIPTGSANKSSVKLQKLKLTTKVPVYYNEAIK